MKVAYHSIYSYKRLPEGHRFPMIKYDLLPKQLVLEGIVDKSDFFSPEPLTEDQILRTHSIDYWRKLKTGTLTKRDIRNMGFPFHKSLVERGKYIAKGTLECAKHALFGKGVALNIAGGTHHAYADRGEGFCMFNDFAIASNELLYEKLVKQILIIDLDVHQGNGNAKIFENEKRVFTFSMHGRHNYPLRKEKSDLDIELEDGTRDDEYLDLLIKNLEPLINKIKPDFIFYLSGVDIIETDKLGRLGVTIEGCKKRDQIVFETCEKYQIPVAVSMGGGYAHKIADIVNAHTNTYKMAREVFD